jgi:chromosome segregation protein
MVHIKRIELSHFKSFGGTTSVPFFDGFTVVSGPNGSGKSNILDAILFCLGLATSKGMRAERLPDLVNNTYNNGRSVAEATVSVSFDLSDLEIEKSTAEDNHSEENNSLEGDLLNSVGRTDSRELTVTRRLRVNKDGNYSSTFYLNGQTCNVGELHQQLNRLRIYPEGYNVVLQGDVTRIITMNARERREIIDELAGVAEFDRKIDKARDTLEEVREREERYRIIEQESIGNLERLADERLKAEKYQKLRAKVQEKQQWEVVLVWQCLQQKLEELMTKIATGAKEEIEIDRKLEELEKQIIEAEKELAELNTRVKAMGEEEQLSVASRLATKKAQQSQFQQKQRELIDLSQQNNNSLAATEKDIQQYRSDLTTIETESQELLIAIIPQLSEEYNLAKQNLEAKKEEVNAVASTSEAWVQEQTELNHRIAELQKELNPKRTEQAQLNERCQQLEKKIAEQTNLKEFATEEGGNKETDAKYLGDRVNLLEGQVQTIVQQLTAAEEELNLAQETQNRLFKEQREKQRLLDKLEATKQAQQEAQGTYATQVIITANLEGICGLVAQLGQVENKYQLALEVAAGGRLGNIVVEDDRVAATAIDILKQKRAGRATFLPLNKIQTSRQIDTGYLKAARGFVDLAVNLIDREPKYDKIFTYVFGNTVVFDTLNNGRSYLGQYRIVTLDGELLEASGAMTGGSISSRSSLHFGTGSINDSEEIQNLQRRLLEIERILVNCDRDIQQKTSAVKNLSQELTKVRQDTREQQIKLEQIDKESKRLASEKAILEKNLNDNLNEIEIVRTRLSVLDRGIPEGESILQEYQQKIAELETANAHTEWQQLQTIVKQYEVTFNSKERNYREAEDRVKELQNKIIRLQERIAEAEQKQRVLQQQKQELEEQNIIVNSQIETGDREIQEIEHILTQLIAKLGTTKQQRDNTEIKLKELQNRQQRQTWEKEKLQVNQQERKTYLAEIQAEIEQKKAELPDPLPEVPLVTTSTAEDGTEISIADDNLAVQLERLQKEIRQGQKRLEAMEPVNMLALEEFDRIQGRLQELSEKLATLEAERTELLLRVEKFTTLRYKAFKQAFDAVNENFQSIFATLSDGDGCLQLEDAENPFNGGLNLVAHPKGKPVQRLSSMSGGEKSLTALSFIFSLQRYRPSPFYAFDEVDMFLDGANVERLSKMIERQAQQAQFIVVSLRRPMIESSQRTIGVTQARGAYTQVLGIKV